MSWRDGESNPKILQLSAAFFSAFRLLDGAALKIECKRSHLNIAFDRYASTSTVMHNILVISERGYLACFHAYKFDRLRRHKTKIPLF